MSLKKLPGVSLAWGSLALAAAAADVLQDNIESTFIKISSHKLPSEHE